MEDLMKELFSEMAKSKDPKTKDLLRKMRKEMAITDTSTWKEDREMEDYLGALRDTVAHMNTPTYNSQDPKTEDLRGNLRKEMVKSFASTYNSEDPKIEDLLREMRDEMADSDSSTTEKENMLWELLNEMINGGASGADVRDALREMPEEKANTNAPPYGFQDPKMEDLFREYRNEMATSDASTYNPKDPKTLDKYREVHKEMARIGLSTWTSQDPKMEALLGKLRNKIASIVASSYNSQNLPNEDMFGELRHAIANGDASICKSKDPKAHVDLQYLDPKIVTEAKRLSQSIFADFAFLKKVLERHEDIIQKRWLKKTNAQRKEIFVKVWPGISKHHRPDIEALVNNGNRISNLKFHEKKYRAAYLWPDFNLEDLSKGKTFLLLLNSRGRHLPETFALSELEKASLGVLLGMETSPKIELAHIMYLAGNFLETYGKIHPVPMGSMIDYLHWILLGKALWVKDAIVVLEIQQRIHWFLAQCCRVVLHNLSDEALTGAMVTILPEPQLLSKAGMDYPSIAALVMEAPYRVPGHLDFSRLKALISAKRTELEDHIWALREDPGYFADVLGERSEHTTEKVMDDTGNVHPDLVQRPGSQGHLRFWDRVVSEEIQRSYESFFLWTTACQEIAGLVNLEQKYISSIVPDKQLPPEFETALQNFNFSLDRMCEGVLDQLKRVFMTSPLMRQDWHCHRDPENPANLYFGQRKGPIRKHDRLHWIFSRILDRVERKKEGSIDTKTLVDAYEHLVSVEPKEKDRLTRLVESTFSELGLITELQRQIKLYQPWFRMMQTKNTYKSDDQLSKLAKPIERLARVIPEEGMGRFVVPLSKFHYPIEKQRSKETNNMLISAETKLDMFWKQVDNKVRGKCGKTLHELFNDFISTDKFLRRTDEWVEPEKPMLSTPSATFHCHDLPLPQSQNQRKHALDFISPAQPKIKTRGVEQATDPIIREIAALHVSQEILDGEDKYEVDQKTFKVFSTLFFNPTRGQQPGQIPWIQFLRAMQSVGFAPEKLYGSVWQFTPVTLDVDRSIQFHEPHPEKCMPYLLARRYGRRLNRAYGWTLETFVLKR